MAKKPRRKAKRSTVKTTGQIFSMVGLHNKLDDTIDRLKKKKKTEKRDELIALVEALRADTPCPQNMLIDLGI